MQCQRCQRDILENESLKHLEETLCEDCYIDAKPQVQACDPLAVYSATRNRASFGLKGIEGLAPIQKEVYELIKNKEKVTAAEIRTNINITQSDLQRVIVTLRHCELVKGQKDGDKIYFVPF